MKRIEYVPLFHNTCPDNTMEFVFFSVSQNIFYISQKTDIAAYQRQLCLRIIWLGVVCALAMSAGTVVALLSLSDSLAMPFLLCLMTGVMGVLLAKHVNPLSRRFPGVPKMGQATACREITVSEACQRSAAASPSTNWTRLIFPTYIGAILLCILISGIVLYCSCPIAFGVYGAFVYAVCCPLFSVNRRVRQWAYQLLSANLRSEGHCL